MDLKKSGGESSYAEPALPAQKPTIKKERLVVEFLCTFVCVGNQVLFDIKMLVHEQ